MAQRIVVIDDDPIIIHLIKETLAHSKYEVTFAANGSEGVRIVMDTKPHLVVLDIMMPDISGLEACVKIRKLSAVPIILLTALSSRKDIVRGLEAGADDYLVKPFDPAELSARVSALLRRSSMPAVNDDMPLRFGNGELVIDPSGRQVFVGGDRIELTPKEFDLLSFLAHRPGRVLSNEYIFQNVWPYDTDANIESVKWYVWRLRKKVEKKARSPKYIITERGVGYKFVPHY